MANVKYSLPVNAAGGELFMVGDPTTRWAEKTAKTLHAEYLGGDIDAAINACVASRYDKILIGPGTYTVTSTIAADVAGVTLEAAILNPTNPTVVITSSIADTFSVDANNVTLSGIEFKAGADACTNLIDVADAAAVAGLQIRNCVFNPNGKASVKAINAADATYAITRSLIEHNQFLLGFDTAAINIGVLGMGNSIIRWNGFQLTAAKVAIALADTTAFATGYGYQIYENNAIGADATGDEVFISIAGTEDTTGCGIIRSNYGSYVAAAAITIDKLSKSEINNYVGDAATGGTLVDPGT